MKTVIYYVFLIFFLPALFSQDTYNFKPRDLDEIKEHGVVRIGLRVSPTVYQIDPETGEPDNYVWDLMKAWAESEGLTAKPVLVDRMIDYWYHKGEIPENIFTDETISYTPDIFAKIDIAADVFSIVPWRLKLVDMHQYNTVGTIAIARKVDNIDEPSDLLGKRLYILENQSEYQLFKTLLEEEKIPYQEINVLIELEDDGHHRIKLPDSLTSLPQDKLTILLPSNPNSNTGHRPIGFYEVLLDNEADLLVNNSLTFLIYNMRNNTMRRYLTPAFSVGEANDKLGVMNPKECPNLSKSLGQFLYNAQYNGLNDELMQKHAGINLEDYNTLLELNDD